MVRVLLGSDRGSQPVLLPVDVRDELPPTHAAWCYLAIVDEVDLSVLSARYRADGVGRPPFDPAMMVALLLYCGSKNIRSSRAIEAACTDDLGCRLITGNRKPDHTTISEFRSIHAEALQGLLPQSIRLCDEAGLVDLELIAGDGSKFEANAAMPATIDEATLRRRIDTLTALVAEREAAWRAGIADDLPEQSTLFDTDTDTGMGTAVGAGLRSGPGGRHGTAWRRLGLARQALARHQDALRHLLTHPGTEYTDWQTRLAKDTERVTRRTERLTEIRAEREAFTTRRAEREAAGERVTGPRPVPVEEHTHVRKARQALATAIARAEATAINPPTTGRVNTTDPTSRIMPTKHGGYDQLHNVQATATTTQIILAIHRHDSPNDKQALTGLLAATRTNLDTAGIHRRIGVAVFDNGYASEANFTADLPVDLLLVAVQREARQTDRLTDGIDTASPAWQTMTDQLAQPTNSKLYKRRSPTIEPVFAQLFNHFGHHLDLRGDHVDTELHLWATTHNLAKLIRHRQRTTRHRTTTHHPPD